MKVRLEKLSPTSVNHEMIWGVIGLIIILIARFVPFSLFPKLKCPFHVLTGYPGPSCGMTRSFILMSHLKFWGALKMNPLGGLLFIVTTIFVAYAFIAIVFRLRRIRIKFTGRWEGVFIRIAFIFVVVMNWIYLIIIKSET